MASPDEKDHANGNGYVIVPRLPATDPQKYSTTRIFSAQSQPVPTIPTNIYAGSATAIKAKSFRVHFPPDRIIRKRIGLDCIQRELRIVRLQRRDIRITARICIEFDQRLPIVSHPFFCRAFYSFLAKETQEVRTFKSHNQNLQEMKNNIY